MTESPPKVLPPKNITLGVISTSEYKSMGKNIEAAIVEKKYFVYIPHVLLGFHNCTKHLYTFFKWYILLELSHPPHSLS
jgi:hypothetical protein